MNWSDLVWGVLLIGGVMAYFVGSRLSWKLGVLTAAMVYGPVAVYFVVSRGATALFTYQYGDGDLENDMEEVIEEINEDLDQSPEE